LRFFKIYQSSSFYQLGSSLYPLLVNVSIWPNKKIYLDISKKRQKKFSGQRKVGPDELAMSLNGLKYGKRAWQDFGGHMRRMSLIIIMEVVRYRGRWDLGNRPVHINW